MAIGDIDEYGRSSLHWAAARGEEAELEALIAAGFDVNLPDTDRLTPLHFAVQAGSAASARVLLTTGATVDPTDRHGNTPLWKAAFGNSARPDLVAVLLEAGADPDRKNLSGKSPRDMALAFDRPGVASLFA